jgi:PIN domain nuclease of toxin-antitoxin system
VIVLDTQALLWLTTDRRRLSLPAAECIREASRRADAIAIASSTLWEIAMNFHKGSLHVPSTLTDYLKGLEQTFQVLPITASIAERSIRFSESYPKDPTDRIIGATAVIHAARLVTKDEKIRASGEVDCVW